MKWYKCQFCKLLSGDKQVILDHSIIAHPNNIVETLIEFDEDKNLKQRKVKALTQSTKQTQGDKHER